MDSDWYIGAGFSFFFNGAVGALYGSHRVYSSIDLSRNSGGPFQKFDSKSHRLAQTIQLKGGIAWGMLFKWLALRIFAAYELNSWYNIQEQYRVNMSGGTDNPDNEKVRILTTCPLNLQGVTTGLSLEF